MKRPESKNSEINMHISAKELEVGHKFSTESSLRQTEVRNMISYKIIIMHEIKTYQLFQRNTHFPHLKPAQTLPQLLIEGTLSNFGDIPSTAYTSRKLHIVAVPPCSTGD